MNSNKDDQAGNAVGCTGLPRSPLLLGKDDSALLIVDVQTKLVNLIEGNQRLVWNNRRLVDAAGIFEIPILATEQYPQGLGGTVPDLAARLNSVCAKTRFSCGECEELFSELMSAGRRKIVIAGIESHVCVMQTALDLLTAGFEIYVVVDAIGSRFTLDHQTAIRRMELAGAFLTTTESVMFEWCEASGTKEFKLISALVRESLDES